MRDLTGAMAIMEPQKAMDELSRLEDDSKSRNSGAGGRGATR